MENIFFGLFIGCWVSCTCLSPALEGEDGIQEDIGLCVRHNQVVNFFFYGCCVWSPYQAKYVDQLESVQTFAARLATKKWSSDSTTLRSLLGWSTLASRRTCMKLCLCRRILVGDSLIPDSTFSPHTSRTVRHINSCPLYQPFVKTSYHLNSFFYQRYSFVELYSWPSHLC